MDDLFLLSERQMARIAPHFPLSHGVPRVDDRRVVSGIVYVIRHGLQWKDAPKGYGPHKTLNCRAYDPTYAYEMAVIPDHGARRMMGEQADEFYYVTAMNEGYAQPSMPEGVAEGIIRGLYSLSGPAAGAAAVRLLGSGAILPEVVAAAALLSADWGIEAEVMSATSFSELAREAREVERRILLGDDDALSHVERLLPGDAPIVAATDDVRAYPQLIASYVEAPFVALGTDGFGRSDTRPALRAFFEVDCKHVVLAALHALARSRPTP